MPRPQKGLDSHGLRRTKRKRRGRARDPQHFKNRPTDGAAATGNVWLLIGCAGVGLTLLGFLAPPLILVGLLFTLVGFAMAVRNYKKARGG